MDSNCDFDSVAQDLGFFFEAQNALNAAQPDLSCGFFSAGLEALFYERQIVNYDWSQLPNELNISCEDDTLLDSRECILRDETEAHTLTRTADFSEWSLMRNDKSETTTPRLVCHYHGCASTPFRTTCDLKMHLKCHSREILTKWAEGQKQLCAWPRCLSKATFKSKRALQTHLENIHVDPLLCPEKDCRYQTPFRSNYDLKRHVRTIHYGEKELQYQCPFPTCEDFPKTFVRKDKWLSHLRSVHNDSNCPLNHCEAGSTDTQDKLVEHIKNSHGNFECGIGSCYQQPPSRFVKFELMKHLEFHHGIQHGDINTAHNAAIQARDRTVWSKDLPSTTSWRDCRLCFVRNGVQEAAKEEKEVISLE